jgi:hypothetical protein
MRDTLHGPGVHRLDLLGQGLEGGQVSGGNFPDDGEQSQEPLLVLALGRKPKLLRDVLHIKDKSEHMQYDTVKSLHGQPSTPQECGAFLSKQGRISPHRGLFSHAASTATVSPGARHLASAVPVACAASFRVPARAPGRG